MAWAHSSAPPSPMSSTPTTFQVSFTSNSTCGLTRKQFIAFWGKWIRLAKETHVSLRACKKAFHLVYWFSEYLFARSVMALPFIHGIVAMNMHSLARFFIFPCCLLRLIRSLSWRLSGCYKLTQSPDTSDSSLDISFQKTSLHQQTHTVFFFFLNLSKWDTLKSPKQIPLCTVCSTMICNSVCVHI